MLVLIASLVLSAAPPLKLDKPKLELPKLDLGAGPAMPKGEGMQGPAKAQDPQVRGVGTRGATSTARVEKVAHAHHFVATGEGHKPQGAITALEVPGLPAKSPSFSTCLRLSSQDGAPAHVQAQLLDPKGKALLSSEGEVVFGAMHQMDFLVEWDPFDIQAAGEYQLAVTVDGAAPVKYPLVVRAK